MRHAARATLKAGAARSRWARALAARLPFSRGAPLVPLLFGGVAETRWRNARLLVDAGELEGYWRYFLPDTPDPEFDFLLERCRGASMLFDIGANQGLYALALSQAHSSLKVVAFEPDPLMATRLRANVSVNPDAAHRITVEQAAVGRQPGTMTFRRSGKTNSGTGRLAADGGPDTIPVQVTTVDSYVEQRGLSPDVIKLDVEGAEVDVLSGITHAWSHLRAMVIELHPHSFEGQDRLRYQAALMAALARTPLAWKFLIQETRWVTTLDPSSSWESRLHAFGVR